MTQPSHVARPLFFHERFLRAGGRRAWNVFLVARLRRDVHAPALRDALAEMQAHHPMLGVLVTPGRRPRFEAPSPPPPIPVRFVERSGEDRWLDEVALELDLPFPTGMGPLMRVVCVTSADASELVLIADHCICDGRSMLVLMRELIEGLRDRRCTRDPQNGAATVQDLFPGRSSCPLGSLRHIAHMGWIARKATAARERLRPERPAPAPYMLRWEIPAAASLMLSERAKVQGVTPYTALATSFLRAIRFIRPQTWRNRLLCPVDARPGIPGIGPGTLFGYPHTVPLSLRQSEDGDFWRQARALHADLIRAKARLDPQQALLTFERLHGLADWFVAMQLHGRPRNDLMFSYLGDAEGARPPDSPDVEAIPAFLSSMPWRGTTAVFCLRDRGTLRFLLVARPDVLPLLDAERIRDATIAAVIQ